MADVLERHSRMPRKFVSGEEQPKDEETGQFLPIPEDRKAAILADLKDALLSGGTLVTIAAKHQISLRTLSYWCAQLGDEYREIRKQWIDAKLSDAEQIMVDAQDPFKLAKGRELFRAASWYAERRDPERYADKRELTVKTDEPHTEEQVRDKIKQLEAKLNIKTIEQEPFKPFGSTEQLNERNEAERPVAPIAPAQEPVSP